ncbi:MAG: hypothetical protein NTV80_03180, partial [Verrucomicrobia bacterium]|nr:hypothetical protein [Verrucomicrobiota bacterium]
MEQGSFSLEFFRRPSLCRDLIVAMQAALTLLMPCYGLPGGAGTALNSLVANWAEDGTADNYEMVNAGQLKYVLKLWYDRLNVVHNTTGLTNPYPWPQGATEDYFAAVNVGQLKNMLRLDVRQPWNNNIAQGNPLALTSNSLGPIANTGALTNRSSVLGSQHHYLRNPLLGLTARGGNQLSIPANAEHIPSAPAATSAGEFKVGQDGSANYTIRLQGPKGVANVEPAISLDYNSNGGDGIVGLGWNLSGLSVTNNNQEKDPNEKTKDRFFLDGERLICISADKPYGTDGSEYRTLKEQFSKIIYKETTNKSWFEVKTKAGLIMEFGNCNTSCIGPKENGSWCSHQKMTWAVNKVKDSLGNYWSVQYVDFSPGQDPAENSAYLPDYQPSVIRYTGYSTTSLPTHEIRFHYEPRPDQHRGYLMGFLVRKTQRLRGVEILTNSTAVRSWRLGYNIGSFHTSRLGERSKLVSVQEVAGPLDLASAPALPASVFTWDEGSRGWESGSDPAEPEDVEQTLSWPGGTAPWAETNSLRLEHRGDATDTGTPRWFPKPHQYVDMDGDGQNEIFISHRGPFWDEADGGPSFYYIVHDYQQLMKKVPGGNAWQVSILPGATSGTPRLCYPYASAGVAAGGYAEPRSTLTRDLRNKPFNPAAPVPPATTVPPGAPLVALQTSGFPYLSTAAGVPTGAFMVDLNQDGLPDILSSGTFEEASFEWEQSKDMLFTKPNRRVINPRGVWMNVGGTLVKDVDGQVDTIMDDDTHTGTDQAQLDCWGDWKLPKVPLEWTASDGAVPVARPSTITTKAQHERLRDLGVTLGDWVAPSMAVPAGVLSGAAELLADPQFARFGEHDLGWRVIDMDGDGDQDIIRAGQGLEASGWLTPTNTVSATGSGALCTQGRQLCFGLENLGVNANAGSRWALRNLDPTINSIWKLPLPLVSTNGKLDMGRRLIDMNGDGLPDFVAQKKRAAADPKAVWTMAGYDEYDLEVWLNRGAAGWQYGGDAWRLEGQMLAFGMLNADIDYGRMLQDMNGDGLPDLIVSFWVGGTSPYSQEGAFLNTGKGWAKRTDPGTGRLLPVNFTQFAPPDFLFVYSEGFTMG